MLSKPDHCPAGVSQCARNPLVAFAVTKKFFFPEPLVSLRKSLASATVPKATVDEQRDTIFGERKIWSSNQLRSPSPPSDLRLSQQSDESNLSAKISAALVRSHNLPAQIIDWTGSDRCLLSPKCLQGNAAHGNKL
jgi:hypothetical protein